MNEIQARAEIAKRGLHLTRHGAGWRLRGARVDVLFANFAALHEIDLLPVVHRMNERNRNKTATEGSQ